MTRGYFFCFLISSAKYSNRRHCDVLDRFNYRVYASIIVRYCVRRDIDFRLIDCAGTCTSPNGSRTLHKNCFLNDFRAVPTRPEPEDGFCRKQNRTEDGLSLAGVTTEFDKPDVRFPYRISGVALGPPSRAPNGGNRSCLDLT